MIEGGPAPFPAGAVPPGLLGLSQRGLGLRPATNGDLPFLQKLYATTRTCEVAAAGWPPVLADAFLASQFELQHRHFVAQGLATDFWIIRSAGSDVGRIYLNRSGPVWRVVDLALLPEARSLGHGAALLRAVHAEARGRGAAGLDLHVLRHNARAAALYMRLGFTPAPDSPESHIRMVWSVS